MRLIQTATNLTARVAAAGTMGLILVAVPAAKAVAHPNPTKQHRVTVTVGNLKAAGGTVALTVDPAVSAGATSLGITLAPVSPTAVNGAVWSFPITAGRIAWLTRTPAVGTPVTRVVGGGITLGGGFTATKGTTTVTVSDIVVHLEPGNYGKVFARINGSGRRLPALAITDLSVNLSARSATASLGITQATASLLNRALTTTSFKAGQKLGTVAVTVPAPV